MHVLVSGAGIAGPALAHGLVGAGHRVTVVESAATPRPGGQAVDVRGPALEVAERMGLGPAVRRARTDMRGMSIVAPDGRELMSTTSTPLTGDRWAAPTSRSSATISPGCSWRPPPAPTTSSATASPPWSSATTASR